MLVDFLEEAGQFLFGCERVGVAGGTSVGVAVGMTASEAERNRLLVGHLVLWLRGVCCGVKERELGRHP